MRLTRTPPAIREVPPAPGAAGRRTRSRAATVPLAAALLLAATALPTEGQVLRGRVLDEATAGPVAAAVVELVDAEGERVDAYFTEADGAFALRAPGAGAYRVRLQRLGYRTATLGPFDLPAGRTVVRDLLFTPAPVRLRGITAEGAKRCVVNPESGAQTAILWDEARKALTGTALVQELELIRFEAVRYRRTLDPAHTTLVDEHLGVGVLTRPFRSPPPRELVDSGFVRAEGDSTTYYMPDADAVLSGAFLASHCFYSARKRGPEGRFVGLAFQPLPGRTAVDVAGVLWLREEDAALSSLEYTYVGLGEREWEEHAGGRAEFERLGTGHWIVRRWAIRMPVLEERSRFFGLSKRTQVSAVREEGGEVVAAYRPDGRLVTRHHVHRLRGVVRDSLHGGALEGAAVRLSGTLHGVASDPEGAFLFEDLPPGEYVVTFHHPVLDTLGTLPPARVVRAPTEDPVRLAVPSRETALERQCPDLDAEGPWGVLAGRVVDASGGAGVPARIRLTVGARPGRPAVREFETDPEGYYRVCAVRVDERLEVRATDEAGGAASGEAVVPDHGFVRLDLTLGSGGRARRSDSGTR